VTGITLRNTELTNAQQSTSFNRISRYKTINIRLGLSTLSVLPNAALLLCAVTIRLTKRRGHESEGFEREGLYGAGLEAEGLHGEGEIKKEGFEGIYFRF
jgi:hypothetical protein